MARMNLTSNRPELAETAAEKTARAQSFDDLKAFDFSTITDPKARKCVRDLWALVKVLYKARS